MSDLLKCIKRNIRAYAQDAAFVALKSLEGDLKYRIHNSGMATRGRIGRYQSASWMRKRREKGLQTAYVDLQFSEQLRDDLTTGQSRGNAVMGFRTDRSKKIHDEMEDRYGKIWRPDTIEIRDLEDRFSNELNDKIRDC